MISRRQFALLGAGFAGTVHLKANMNLSSPSNWDLGEGLDLKIDQASIEELDILRKPSNSKIVLRQALYRNTDQNVTVKRLSVSGETFFFNLAWKCFAGSDGQVVGMIYPR